jgi:thiamine kinase-like enzyme
MRTYQVNAWLDLLSKSGLNTGFSKNKILVAFQRRDSKYDSYTLSLRDCGTHNAIYDGNKTFLIDFERSCFSYPSDDLASLIVENILPEKIIIEKYISAIRSHTYDDKEFNFELSSSLFEKSLEILTYFKTNKDNISESKRESILNKYANLVNKYYERLCQNLNNGN